MSALRLLGLGLLLGSATPLTATAAPQAPVIGCASLVNLRILMRQTKADAGAAAAILGDDAADHLGCAILARDAVTARQEHLTLNGNAYDCLTLRGTSVCQWVVAGAVTLGERPAKARANDKGRPAEKATGPDKPGAQDKARR